MGILHAPAFFFFFFKKKHKEPHNYRIPGQFSRNVVDIWSGPFWKQPSHEAQTDWLTPLAKLQPAHPPYFTQNKKARKRLLSRVQFRVYVHLPSQHLHLTPSLHSQLLTWRPFLFLFWAAGISVLWTPGHPYHARGKSIWNTHFLLLWCPCISVVRSLLISTMVRKVLPREWISGTLAGAGGEGNGNPAQCSCLENPTEPGMPQSTGSRRVRHDLEQQQQHGAGATKGLFYWSHLSCLKGQPESDMLCALQVLDEDKQVKALGLLCLPCPFTLSWPARPHPFPQPAEVSWLIFTFLCIT